MIRSRQRLGKYRIERRIAQGGFADVFRAYDTIEGVPVALKIAKRSLVNRDNLDSYRNEVRISATLVHPNILPIKNADIIDGHLVIATPLAETSFDTRLRSRISAQQALHFTKQMLSGLAHAHEHRIIHCDVKPENFLLFADGGLRLGDFGIAKMALRTRVLSKTGSGTLGYMAPEHALGRPTFRSDVFSVALVIYRMFSGELPDWPYDLPLPGFERLRRKLHPDFIAMLHRALRVNERQRYRDAAQMYAVFQELERRALHPRQTRRRPRTTENNRDWKTIRHQEFKKRWRRILQADASCTRCKGAISEAMIHCPWCGVPRKKYQGPSRFDLECKRCNRGMKADWKYCPWCYGAGYEPSTTRELSDRRYTARCAHAGCERRVLMPFMRYCPWCQSKVKQRWPIESSKDRCPRCTWGVLGGFWDHCPWCGKRLANRAHP